MIYDLISLLTCYRHFKETGKTVSKRKGILFQKITRYKTNSLVFIDNVTLFNKHLLERWGGVGNITVERFLRCIGNVLSKIEEAHVEI